MKKFKIMITISLILFIITGYLYSITEKKTDLKTNIVIEESKENLPTIEETSVSDTEAHSEEIEEKPKDINNSKTNVMEKKTQNQKSKSTPSKNNTPKATTSKTVETNKTDSTTTSESSNKPEATPKIEVKEEHKEEKKEETTKEVVVEVPDSNSYKDDPAFIKLQKELFRTFKECNDAGEKEWRKDSDNVSNIYCEAEYYKGAEAGIRLYIVYNDKTWKKYSR